MHSLPGMTASGRTSTETATREIPGEYCELCDPWHPTLAEHLLPKIRLLHKSLHQVNRGGDPGAFRPSHRHVRLFVTMPESCQSRRSALLSGALSQWRNGVTGTFRWNLSWHLSKAEVETTIR